MQVPERLALIGGSILLASTLVFTLKSQASTIIPKVSHSISGIYDHIGDAQSSSNFHDGYQRAQKNGWQTGNWGTAPFYVDNQYNMYVGSGDLDGNLRGAVGPDKASTLHTLNFQEEVHMSRGGNDMQGGANNNLTQINGLDRVDTSNAYNFDSMFAGDDHLTDLDLSSWDTSKVWNVHSMVYGMPSLKNLNVSTWDTRSLNNMPFIFASGDNELTHINLSNWDTTHVGDMFSTFEGSVQTLTLGNQTLLKDMAGLPNAMWKNGDQTLSTGQLKDYQPHPGTWVRQ